MNLLERTLMTISCRDTDSIPKVVDAGKMRVENGERIQVMHNGVRVAYGGYCGEWMAQIIRGLDGHHEPQEELLFHTLLKYVRHRSLMIELGAYWGYYTQWFLDAIPDSTALCVEPDTMNMQVGVHNARLNNTSDRVNFINAWVGGENLASHSAVGESTGQSTDLPMLNYPALLEKVNGACIELLHVDTQGAELPLLQSITTNPDERQLRFVVVSTHHSSISGSSTTHQDCIDALHGLGATVLVEHDVVESFSGDGLIVASLFPEDKNLRFPAISRNRARTSLFSYL